MALFGNQPRLPVPGVISGYGGGTWNPDGSVATPQDRIATFGQNPADAITPELAHALTWQPNMPAQPKKSGLFGSGSALWKVLGSVGDALSAANGTPMLYAPSVLKQRQHQQTMAEKAADRQAEYQQAMDLARFKATLPVNNDTANDYAFRVQTLGKDAADEWLRNAGDPIVTVQLPGNRVYSGPRSKMAAALGGTATGPGISMDDWNKGTPVGGGASNGTGGFRP